MMVSVLASRRLLAASPILNDYRRRNVFTACFSGLVHCNPNDAHFSFWSVTKLTFDFDASYECLKMPFTLLHYCTLRLSFLREGAGLQNARRVLHVAVAAAARGGAVSAWRRSSRSWSASCTPPRAATASRRRSTP